MKYRSILITFLGLSILFASYSPVCGQKWLEKAIKAKAASAIKAEGIVGRVLVYSSPDRSSEITDITGVQKIYCRAYPHPKAAKQAASATRSKFGLWEGTDCTFLGGTSCKDFFTEGGEIEASNWTDQEYVDFEVDMVEATDYEIKNGMLDEMNFYVILDGGTNNRVRLAVSNPITFNPQESVGSFTSATTERNKDLKLKESVFSDSELKSRVTSLLNKFNVNDIGQLNFTTSWKVDYDGVRNPLRRSCKANASGRDELGNCKFYWFTVWEEYDGAGNFQLPANREDINRVTSELVPCSSL